MEKITMGGLSPEQIEKIIFILNEQREKLLADISSLDTQIQWYSDWIHYPDKPTNGARHHRVKRISNIAALVIDALGNHDTALPLTALISVVHASLSDNGTRIGKGKLKSKIKSAAARLIDRGEIELTDELEYKLPKL